jgi:enoyl-CoA hydratase/carnithine racemase
MSSMVRRAGMDNTEIIYEKNDGVAVLTLNRPSRLNAFTAKMGLEIKAAMMDADRDNSVRAIVATGAGRAFCSGADQKMAAELRAARAASGANPEAGASAKPYGPDTLNDKFDYMLNLRKPIIGAIKGHSVGLGFTMTLFFDVRIAGESAKMGLLFVRTGRVLEQASAWMLPRLIGVPRAMEMAITGRLVTADEALAMGLVTRVVPDDLLMPTALEMAREIATNCAPTALALTKQSIYRHMHTDLETAWRDSYETAGRMPQTEDYKEAARAFAEKRAPRFPGFTNESS